MANFVGAQGNRSLSDNGAYVEFVESAVRDYAVFSTFKQSPDYRAILEHTPVSLALEYIKVFAVRHPQILQDLDRFRVNDQVGGSELFNFPLVGVFSTSTMRYLKVASDLLALFGELHDQRIAEIGVGYGGQTLISDRLMPGNQYQLFDLAPVLSLTSRYLESHTLKGAYKTLTLNQSDGKTEYDLVISNYAFSELPSALQRQYVDKVLSKARRGYLTMNSGAPDCPFVGDFLSFEELATLLPPFTLQKEMPGYPSNSYILTWGANPSATL